MSSPPVLADRRHLWAFAAGCVAVTIGVVLHLPMADLYGRRASTLLSAVMFVGTSICGSMPSLWWNVGMCFLMGAAAGGMLPVTYALLAETMPSKQRGWALVLVGGLGAVGLLGIVYLELASPADASPVLPIAVLIIGLNGIIAMLLPYAAESYPLKVRGRATGWVAACTKAGGLAAQALSRLGLIPGLALGAALTLVPVVGALVLVLRYCTETRGRDLREMEAPA